jgi:muconolactone D-isomerase
VPETTDPEYLVEIHVHLPPDMSADQREGLLAAELRRGRELKAAGSILRIWRVAGATRNVGVWQTADATELHELISSLPLFPYMDVTVTALARHPVESPN